MKNSGVFKSSTIGLKKLPSQPGTMLTMDVKAKLDESPWGAPRFSTIDPLEDLALGTATHSNKAACVSNQA